MKSSHSCFPFQGDGSKLARLHGANSLLHDDGDALVKPGETLVAGMAAGIANVDLLDDDGKLEQAVAVVEEHVRNIAATVCGVALEELAACHAAGQRGRPHADGLERFRVACLNPIG